MALSIKRLSITSRGLRYKLLVAFCLMSVIPLLSCIYFIANYILKNVRSVPETSVIVFMTAFIIILGLHLIRDIVDSIIKISKDAKAMAEEDIYRLIEMDREDEIGDIGSSLNTIIKRMKEKVDELYNLNSTVERLKVKDDLTSIYNERYIREHLDEEIKRAALCQRPCSFILFDIDDFAKFRALHGTQAAETVLKKVAMILQEGIGDISKAGRMKDDDRFAVLLPEKDKSEALHIAYEICKKVENVLKDGKTLPGYVTISGGVSENPLDGATADEIFIKAETALAEAKAKGKNRVSG